MARKKTTLMFDENLYAAIRLEAAKRRLSVSDVVAEASRQYLAHASGTRKKVVLPSAKGAVINLPPHIDIRSTSQVMQHLDELDREAGLPPSQF